MYNIDREYHTLTIKAFTTALSALSAVVVQLESGLVYIGYTTPTRRFSVSLNRRVGVV